MPVKNAKDMFVFMLSELQHGSQRTSKFFDEISQKAQDEDVKISAGDACIRDSESSQHH